ncbi:hypothetical protein BGAL_0551g00050 [Botrytis galanthina]|uniref:RING-type domain-containing protein n=1 Tax=Botrytis galanthina TaxID=278940 RepID=A0A4S8QK68_9HELO|nr:hypothetical protein BGAL_0551g00050 [Botrytis galanthina]
MVYRSRIPGIIDLLRQNGRDDLELRFRRDLQTYGPEIRNRFRGLLTPDRQNELLERFVFSRTFPHGSRFPGDMALDDLSMLPDPADGGHPPRPLDNDFILFGIPHLPLFATAFREIQARERRLHESAMQFVQTTSQPHIYDNRPRADGRNLETATSRPTILPPKIDDSRDDDSPPAKTLKENYAPEDDDICPICQEGYSDAHPSASLIPNCGHFFHMDCMVQWINSESIGGQSRDRCICCRREYFGLLSQFHGEVFPPQGGEDFWRDHNGPLVNEVFPRLDFSPSPYYSSDEEPLIDEDDCYFDVPPGQGARKNQAELQD